MRRLAFLLAVSATPALTAQTTSTRVMSYGCPDMKTGGHGDRAVLGLSTSSGSLRDTLGILVTGITSNGPAEKAGLEEGDRLASVNGVDLRISAADAGDRETSGLMAHRLIRTLEKIKPGDAVELRVYYNGATRTVKVTAGKASDVFAAEGMLGLNGIGALQLDMSQLDTQLEPAMERLRAPRAIHVQPIPDGMSIETIDNGPHKI